MFASYRAGGIAAAIALLSAPAGAGYAQDLVGSPTSSSIPSIVAPTALVESPQVVVPVQSVTLPVPVIVETPAAEPAPVVLPIVTVVPAAPKKVRASLAAMVAEHRSTSVPDRERECLAGAIYFESKGEPLSGQIAVGQVIANRAKSGRFPKSWCGVVFQRSQFSFVRGRALPPIPRASAHWKTAVAVAHIVANDMHEAVAPKALFFHARYVSPNWKRVSKVAAVGNHIFYR